MTVPWLDMVARVVNSDRTNISRNLLDRTSLTVADTIGVIRAGFQEREMRRLLEDEFIDEFSPRVAVGGALLLSTPARRTSARAAAFLNATAGSFLELDEGIRPTGHPAMHVVPAALAAAEKQQSSGDELLFAILQGYEIAARLFRSYSLSYPIHPHGHLGAVGAAVAAALVFQSDPVKAAAIAATSPLMPSWGACLEGATARNTWMGYAASHGIQSALLARAGFRGSSTGLDDIFGAPSSLAELEAQVDFENPALGTGYFKRHSACALTHSALDAALLIAPNLTSRITAISIETVQNNMKISSKAAKNSLSTRFSLPYAVAAALTLKQTDAEAMRWRPEVAEVENLVQVKVCPDLQKLWPSNSPARVSVSTETGQIVEVVNNPRGYFTNPLSVEELRAKFLHNTMQDNEAWAGLTSIADASNIATVMTRLFDAPAETKELET